MHCSTAQHRLRQPPQHILCQVHGIAVIGIGPIVLQHGELGIVSGRKPFVAEVAVDLVDALKAADREALQVKLRRNAQVHVEIQGVMVSNERFRRGTAGNHLHHGCFHFHEAALVHVLADEGDDLGATLKHLPGIRVHDQVDVALPIAELLIGQTVVFVRQRSQRLGQQPRLFHVDIQIALTGFMQGAPGGHDITEIPCFDPFQRVGIQHLAIDVQLYLCRPVLYQQKSAAVAHQTTGHRIRLIALLQLLFGRVAKACLQLRRHGAAAKIVREGVAALTQPGELGAPLGYQPILVLWVVSRLLLWIAACFGHSLCPLTGRSSATLQ